MSDSTTQENTPPTKKHRWEEVDEFTSTKGEEATRATMQSIPSTTRWSSATPRWSSATPREYGHETPRLATPFMGETSTWRGMSTPTVGQYTSEVNVATPRFGSIGIGSQTPSMLSRQVNAFGSNTSNIININNNNINNNSVINNNKINSNVSGVTNNNNINSNGNNNNLFMRNNYGGDGKGINTPVMEIGATPLFTGATPIANLAFGATPNYQFEGSTPVQSHFATSAAETQSANNATIEAAAKKIEREWRRKNRRLTVEYLNSILPTEFFTPVPVPPDYNPLPPDEPNFYELALKSLDVFAFSAARANATSLNSNESEAITYDIPDSLGEGMPIMKPEDAPVFVELLKYHNVDNIPDEHLPSYLLMKNLFKLKNGDNAQRRSGVRFLLDKARIFGSSFIFQRLFAIWTANILDVQQKHYMIDFIKSLIAHMNREVRSSTKEIIHMIEPLLSAQESLIREDGKEVITLLTRVVGFQSVFDAIKHDFAHDENVVRRYTAKVCAIASYATNVTEALGALQDMSFSPLASARQTVARTLNEIAILLGRSLLSTLPELVPTLNRLIRDDRRVKRDAALALATIAEVCAPYGINELEVLVDVVCEECHKGLGYTSGPFLQAFGALVSIMSEYDAEVRIAAMMPTLVNQFNTPEEEYRKVMLNVVRKCISANGVSASFIREVVLGPFFSGFWAIRRVAADHRSSAALIAATSEMARKLGSEDILTRLIPEMKAENEAFQRMVILAVKRVIYTSGLDGLSDSLVIALLDGAVTSVRQDELGTNNVVMEGLACICNALGNRLKPCLSQIFDLINSRRERGESAMRAQAAHLVARIAHTVEGANGGIFLQDLGRSIYERLEDSDAMALSAKLRATRAILNELGSRRYKPSVRELLKKLTFIIKNRYSDVQQNTIALIEDIATKYEFDVDAIHLYELATNGLFELLDADRRRTRQACARTFGLIARTIRPFAIIVELVDNFRQDKRKIRNCTAIALGAIARACGPFTVIPYLLNEYKVSEGEQVAVIVQHSIMKAIRYIFEFIGATGKEYVYVFVPLLQRALTETSLQMRRMAVEACRAIIMAIAGADGFTEVTLHLLNFVHPNIVELLSKNEVKISEERLKMVSAVVSFYEAAHLVLGSGKILQYLQQGLFHPARKVRDIYRRTYNMIYLASPQSLVPFYPHVDDDFTHRYTRYELEVIL